MFTARMKRLTRRLRRQHCPQCGRRVRQTFCNVCGYDLVRQTRDSATRRPMI